MKSFLSLCFAATCSLTSGIVFRSTTDADGNSSARDCALPSFATWCTVSHTAKGTSFQMAVYRYNDIVSTSICNQGFWETPGVSDLGPPGTALDIGANVGYYSFLLAEAGWRVEAFEPLPNNLELIKATACRNPELAAKIKIHSFGLGAHDDSCVFLSGHDNVGDGWVRCGDEAVKMRSGLMPVPAGYGLRGSFPVKRLDDVLAAPGAPKEIDYVKIDVEGFECQVFKGGSSVLSNFRPRNIQSEVWPKMDHCKPTDYLDMFHQARYKVAKFRGCPHEDASLTPHIEDFFMCRKGPVLLQLAF